MKVNYTHNNVRYVLKTTVLFAATCIVIYWINAHKQKMKYNIMIVWFHKIVNIYTKKPFYKIWMSNSK